MIEGTNFRFSSDAKPDHCENKRVCELGNGFLYNLFLLLAGDILK